MLRIVLFFIIMSLKIGDLQSLPLIDFRIIEVTSADALTTSNLFLNVGTEAPSKQLDLIRQIDRSSFIIKALNLLIFIFFLVVILVGAMALRSFIKAKRDLIEKNEQISFYNKKLVEKNAELQQEIKRRMDESIFELSQRELVLGSLQESDQKFSAAFYHNPDMVLIFELDSGKILDCNDLFIQHFELELVDLLEKRLLDTNLGFSESFIDEIRNELKQKNIVRNYEISLGEVDAKKRMLNVSISLIQFRHLDCCCMTLRDVTTVYYEQKKVQKLVRRYQYAYKYSELFAWSIDLDMNFEFIDCNISLLLGYEPSELLGKSFYSIVTSSSQKLISECIGEKLRKAALDDFSDVNIDEEFECLSKDGQKKIFRFVGELVYKDAYFIRIDGFSKDLSREKLLEVKVAENKHFYKSLLSSLNDIVIVFDEKYEVLFVSKSVYEFIGYDYSEMKSKSLEDFLTEKSSKKLFSVPSMMPQDLSHYHDNSQGEMDYELDFVSKEGAIKTAYVRMRWLFNLKFRTKSYVAVMRDITEEKKMQEKNRKSEMYFKKLFDDSPVMMLITDDLDIILDANKAFIDTVGYSLYELKSMAFSSLLKRNGLLKVDVNEKDIKADLNTRNGSVLSILMRPADFTDSNQKRMSLFVIRDVSQQVWAENLRTIRENQYVAIAETSPNILIRFDKSLLCTYANKAIEKHFDIRIEQVVGKTPKDFIPDSEAAELLYQNCLSALVDEKEIVTELKLVIGNFERFYNIRVIPEVDASGIVNSVICVVTNVTDYVSAIESLEKNIQQKAFLNQIIAVCNKVTNVENLLRSLHDVFKSQQYDLGFAGFLLNDERHKVTLSYSSLNSEESQGLLAFYNFPNRIFELSEYFYSSVISEDFLILREDVVFENGQKTIEILPLMSKNSILGYVVFTNLQSDKLRWLMSGVERMIWQEAGSAVHRILAEQKHFQSNEFYRILVEATDDLVWRIGTDLNFEFISEKSKLLLGYFPEELKNNGFLSLINESHREQVEQFVILNSNNPEMFSFYDVPMIHKAGHMVSVEMQIFPIFDEHRQFIGYSGVFRDIALRKLNEELRRSKEIAEGMSRVKQEFLDNISHEIRTPLNAIIGMTEIMSTRLVDEEQQQFMNAIKKNGSTLLGLINNVLDLSKIEAGKLKLNLEKVNMDVFLNDLFVAFMSLANSKGLILEFKIAPNLPNYVELDSMRIKQVLLNLLSNAVKFTEKGTVLLDVSTSEINSNKTNIIIRVEDTGVGIPQDELDLIWESFVQSRNNRSFRHGGSGLGLDISKKIVELMKGNIEVFSEINRGTSFKVSLPEVVVYDNELNCFFEGFENCVLLGFSVDDQNLLTDVVVHNNITASCLSYTSIDEIGVIPESPLLLVDELVFYKPENEKILTDFCGRIVVFVSQLSSYKTSSCQHVRCHSKSRFALVDAIRRLKEIKPNETPQIIDTVNSKDQTPMYTDFYFNEFFILQSDPLWEKVNMTNAINDMMEFCELLKDFAEEKDIAILKDYARQLALAIKMFDITKIQELMKKYPEVKNNVLEMF
jgi:PAS domain S-box-containing protein